MLTHGGSADTEPPAKQAAENRLGTCPTATHQWFARLFLANLKKIDQTAINLFSPLRCLGQEDV